MDSSAIAYDWERARLEQQARIEERLEQQANEKNISVSEFCRQKLRDNDRILKIEFMLEDLINKLNCRR